MKLFIAALATETNSFSPIPTGQISFEETFVSRRATDAPPNLFSAPLHECCRAATDLNWEIIESLPAFAQPARPTVRTVYESYRDEILADLRKAEPEIVLLSMHEAIIADGNADLAAQVAQVLQEFGERLWSSNLRSTFMQGLHP